MKVLSLIIIVLGTTAIGAIYGETMKKRLKQLYEMDRIMLAISNEITYLMTPLPEMFMNLSKDTSPEFGELFKQMNFMIEEGGSQDVYHAYKSIRSDLSSEFYFNGEDMKVIDSFFKNLGSSDVRGELNTIEYSRGKMKRIIRESEEKIKKEYKLVTSLSVAIGLVIVIIIV